VWRAVSGGEVAGNDQGNVERLRAGDADGDGLCGVEGAGDDEAVGVEEECERRY
jgi:hypothetical protein